MTGQLMKGEEGKSGEPIKFQDYLNFSTARRSFLPPLTNENNVIPSEARNLNVMNTKL
jgi:hypothetical protein